MMKEVAEQELKALEAQHPTRFQHLKLHLKEFIHLLDEQHDPHYSSFKHHHSTITTEESSSSRKRRQRENDEEDDGYTKPKTSSRIRSRSKRGGGGDGGIRDAIHKAEACLHKIRTLKKSFFCSSNH